jgi:hypothetical protein
MNLEEIGLVQLSTTEVQETEGGLWEVVFAATGPIGWVNGALFALGAYNGYSNH